MARWEPDARGRLTKAALELFLERGYEQTTALDVAERAGVTERTFFRYFADKKEVLFDGSTDLQQTVIAGMVDASPQLTPLEVVVEAFVSAASFMEARHDFVSKRNAVIARNPSLQERELLKLATMSGVIAEALRTRGIRDPAAMIAAETGVMVFKVGFENWMSEGTDTGFARHVEDALARVRDVAVHS